MKNLLYFFSFCLLISCKNEYNHLENGEEEFNQYTFEEKRLTLEKIGEKYYSKNCKSCHGSRGIRDNMFEYAIKSERYEYSFIKSYITHQDSLLESQNKQAIQIKDDYGNQPYRHNFLLHDKEVKAIIYYLKQ